MGIEIYLDKCTGCGNCVNVCPFQLLEVVDDKVVLKDGCTFCSACQEVCAFLSVRHLAFFLFPLIARVQQAYWRQFDIIEIIRNPVKLVICSKFASNLTECQRTISCQYLEFIIISDTKWISPLHVHKVP